MTSLPILLAGQALEGQRVVGPIGAPAPRATLSLVARRSPLAPPAAQLERLQAAARASGRLDFADRLAECGAGPLEPAAIETLQINLGKLCNMTCRHCHVDAGPDRTTEVMSRETVDECLRVLDATTAHTVDLTGGAPELNPSFRFLVDEVVRRGKHVIDRCNLTILLTGPGADLPEWLGDRGVEIVCSLPHHGRRNTDLQRGDGTFERSVEALRRLNAVGYGRGDPRKRLTLMANPSGAYILTHHEAQEREWRAALERRHGVTFDRLIALNNMPIARFLEWLLETEALEGYLARLAAAFNHATIGGLMCRNTLSVSWDGYLYDCDFNQMLDLKIGDAEPEHVRDFCLERLAARRIRTASHCFGCTAGIGSSCTGATTPPSG